MFRNLTRVAVAVAPVALALTMALTGCGSEDGGDEVASAGGAKTGDNAAGAAATLSPDEMGVKYAQCLREHGLDVADPEPGKGIQLKIDKSVGEETVNEAMEACREYDPQSNRAAGTDPKAEENGRRFAVCMRENGVESFPDPEPGQRGIRIDGTISEDPDFEAAQEKCDDILSGGAGGAN